ncbi:contactin-6 [Polymixia lowei]
MLGFVIVSDVWCLLMILVTFSETFSVSRISVPEEHRIYLRCSSSDDVIWTHRDRRVIATKQGNYETTHNRNKYSLLDDGSLCIDELERSDSGEYRCNQQLVAEVEVLTGREFIVSAGRTLLLPCRGSNKPKQRWVHRRGGEKRELIFTWFRNGTVKRERDDPHGRFTFDHDGLQIRDLQLGDAGDYLCNKEVEAKVIIMTVQSLF